MSLIIKNKIGNVIPGTPTISDKYDVITALCDKDDRVAGTFVQYENVFKGNSNIGDVNSTSTLNGIISHQNVHLEFDSSKLQTYRANEILGICVKGFITALAKEDLGNITSATEVKVESSTGLLATAGDVTIKNVRFTGYKYYMKDIDKYIYEVEIK